MSEPNPYGAPAAKVADRDPAAGSPVKGVIYGVLVDILGTLGATVAFGLGYGIYLASSGVPLEEIERAGQEVDPTSGIGLAGTFIGLGFSVLGGYVCARVAGAPELKWAAIVGAISAVSGFLIAMGSESYSAPLSLLSNGLSFAAVMVGGYLGARRNAARP